MKNSFPRDAALLDSPTCFRLVFNNENLFIECEAKIFIESCFGPNKPLEEHHFVF